MTMKMREYICNAERERGGGGGGCSSAMHWELVKWEDRIGKGDMRQSRNNRS